MKTPFLAYKTLVNIFHMSTFIWPISSIVIFAAWMIDESNLNRLIAAVLAGSFTVCGFMGTAYFDYWLRKNLPVDHKYAKGSFVTDV